MVKYFFGMAWLCCITLTSWAQQLTQMPVQWKFEAEKNNTGSYTLIATATIEKGWHVFTTEPGGDGSLIPTTLTIDENKGIKIIQPFRATSKITRSHIDGFGEVNYVEGMGQFSVNFTIQNKELVGTLSYQCCNDKMCLPPTDIPFRVELK